MNIVENYSMYRPPIEMMGAVSSLMASVPEAYLGGLGAVILTNTAALNHDRRRSKTKSRGRKVGLDRTRGMYHGTWKGEKAWIEIFVDKVLNGVPTVLLRIPLLRDLTLGEVLYHEIGHHVHRTKMPEYREPEDVADNWVKKLMGLHMRRRYWYLLPAIIFVKRLWSAFGYVRRRFAKAANA